MFSVRMIVIGLAFAGYSLCAATECVWKGGVSGDVWVADNWQPARIPSSPSASAYVAVFTNSVELTSANEWCPAGIVVSNNAEVICKAGRCTPAGACENGEFVVSVEGGSSFIFDGTIFRGSPQLSLVKKGEGVFNPKGWCGTGNQENAYWGSIDVQGGNFLFPADSKFVCVGDSLYIRSGATVRVGASSPFGENLDKGFSYPQIKLEEGGVFDLNGKSAIVSTLSGSGEVCNCSATLTLNLRISGAAFAGGIFGGGTLAVTPQSSLTPIAATWIVGSANALAGVSLVRNAVEGCSYEVLFTPEIRTFYAKTVPGDRPCFDTEGIPVEIARSGNFWYVDCNHKGEVSDGKSLDSAFKTLKAAMENQLLGEGDTVWVAPGDYAEGEMTDNNALVRVVVPKGVRLVSLGNAENTAIVGSALPNEENYGIGEGAVRCAVLKEGATLRGFTLRGGRTAGYGGGISAATDSVIIGCVISNCVAVRGGGVHKGNYFNCRFSSNRATGGKLIGAHILEYARLYNCLLEGGLGACDWFANRTDSLALNCTFADNSLGSVRGLDADSSGHVKVYNSLVLSHIPRGSWDEFFSSVIVRNVKVDNSATFDSQCTVTNLTASTVPSIYRFAGIDRKAFYPKSSSSRLVGAADLVAYKSLFPVEQYFLSGYDVYGERRIRGNELDIGAAAYNPNRPILGVKVIIR